MSERRGIHCSECGMAGRTKKTCATHCWDMKRCLRKDCPLKCREFGFCWYQRRCHTLDCAKCKAVMCNYGRVLKETKCTGCGYPTTHYENGSAVGPFTGYDTDHEDEDYCTTCGEYWSGY